VYRTTAQAERSHSIDLRDFRVGKSLVWRQRSRRGIQVLEAILVLPILLIAILSGFLFAPLMAVNQATISAAEEAAREGAKQLGNQVVEDIVLETAGPILAVHGLRLEDEGGAMVIIEQFEQPVICRGDIGVWNDCPNTSTVTDAAEVRVTVRVAVKAAPIPQVLKYFGVDLSSQTLECTALARKDL